MIKNVGAGLLDCRDMPFLHVSWRRVLVHVTILVQTYIITLNILEYIPEETSARQLTPGRYMTISTFLTRPSRGQKSMERVKQPMD